MAGPRESLPLRSCGGTAWSSMGLEMDSGSLPGTLPRVGQKDQLAFAMGLGQELLPRESPPPKEAKSLIEEIPAFLQLMEFLLSLENLRFLNHVPMYQSFHPN